MKRLILLVMLAVMCSATLPLTALGAEDPFLVNQSLFWLDCPSAGVYTVELVIHNVSNTEKSFGVSSWVNYTYPDETEEWIPQAWVKRIIPESMVLPVNGKMIVMVEYDLPPEAMNRTFKTWLKVYDDPETVAKPITVRIRTGDAIPTYQYSISPSSYRLRAFGMNASVVVDDANDRKAPPISVRNECSAVASYCASIEGTGKDIVISADSAIQHTADEVGMTFKALTTEEAQRWFSTPYTYENPLYVQGFKTGMLTWALSVPDDAENGCYAMAIRIGPAESREGGSVGIEYLVWLLVEVDREAGRGIFAWLRDTIFSWPWWLVTIGAVVGLVSVYHGGRFGLRRLKERYANGNGKKKVKVTNGTRKITRKRTVEEV